MLWSSCESYFYWEMKIYGESSQFDFSAVSKVKYSLSLLKASFYKSNSFLTSFVNVESLGLTLLDGKSYVKKVCAKTF